MKPKNITFEEVENAIEHTIQCLYFMKEYYKVNGEFQFNSDLEKWIYNSIYLTREKKNKKGKEV